MSQINLENIHKISQRIIADLDEENKEMEAEVSVLQTALDREVECVASRQNTPSRTSSSTKSVSLSASDTYPLDEQEFASKPSTCAKCGNITAGSIKGLRDPGKIRARKGLPTPRGEECHCKSKSSARHTTPTSLVENSDTLNLNSHDDFMTARCVSSKSKFRSRLQAAQDEKHFIDDEI